MSKRTRGDLQFILPKEDSTTVSQPEKVITKTIDLQIEDFLEKLNDLEDSPTCEDFITLPRVLMGNYRVPITFWYNNHKSVVLDITNVGDGIYCNLRSMHVTGNIGNLTFEKSDEAGANQKMCVALSVELGSVEELKEAMINTGNHKLDLQVAVTVLVTLDSDEHEEQWIIQR